MVLLIYIILQSLVAWWCYSVAKGQGRSPDKAAVLGFIFGLYAIVGYYLAGDKKTQE